MRAPAHGIAAATLLALALFTGCGEDDVGWVNDKDSFAEEPFSFNIGLETRTLFVLQGISGSVEVTGDPAATLISVSGVRRVESDSEEDAAAHLPLLEVVADSSVTDASVRTVQPVHAEGRNYIVNYSVTLPQDLALTVGTINAM
jgi:hypothetical protein